MRNSRKNNQPEPDGEREPRAPAGLRAREPELNRYHDLEHLVGSWTPEEAAEFDRVLAELRRIEPEMWT